MIQLNYQKRKNPKLFKSLENSDKLFLSKTQNYIPIYNRFFSLNETNYNNINLNHKWFMNDIKDKIEDTVFQGILENTETGKTKTTHVFFKLAPLLDPFKYLIGKYDLNDAKLFELPTILSNETNTMSKYIDTNNSAYIDSFFLYLNSLLIHRHGFLNGVDYYGSFLSIKNNYKINILDDLEYLTKSDFFIENKNKLFQVDDYDHLLESFQGDSNESVGSGKKSKLKIEDFDILNHDIIDIESDLNLEFTDHNLKLDLDLTSIDLDLRENLQELVDLTNDDNNSKMTLKSNSSCSSRTSYTETEEENIDSSIEKDCEDNEKEQDDNDEDNDNESDEEIEDNDNESDEEIEDNDNEDDEDEWEDVDSDDSIDETPVNAVIPTFPVQVICMEHCSNTLDQLIMGNDLSQDEWLSALLQVIMILITFQKAFQFTHNDLHTNNIMFIETDKKYLYYCHNGKYYKVPTFGKIFKIIDFGRSIYHFNGKLFCSDSFQDGEDASTQYNTEPYFNDKKTRIDPNFSFDLCRLACSIFDYVVDDLSEIRDLEKCDPIVRLIVEWCLDDKGINILYKTNGDERYPDFKLYKMIARCVHKHTPEAQLERNVFKSFIVTKKMVPTNEKVFNIDLVEKM